MGEPPEVSVGTIGVSLPQAQMAYRGAANLRRWPMPI